MGRLSTTECTYLPTYLGLKNMGGLGQCVAPISEGVSRVNWGCTWALTFGPYPP